MMLREVLKSCKKMISADIVPSPICKTTRIFHYQKVSEFYENYCLKNFLLLFMSLLTTPIDKHRRI